MCLRAHACVDNASEIDILYIIYNCSDTYIEDRVFINHLLTKMFRSQQRAQVRALLARFPAAFAPARYHLGAKRSPARMALAASVLVATASFSSSCDATVKYIRTASGLQYRNIVVGNGPVATKGKVIFSRQ